MHIKENIEKLRYDIDEVCNEIGTNPDTIKIIAVTKNVNIENIREAITCGMSNLGENRVQEFLNKFPIICDNNVKWHLIGHLQTNKVKHVVGSVCLIQSVDSIKLTQEIDKKARELNIIQDILVEVKTSFEETKFGISIDSLNKVLDEISGLSNIKVKGLMTIAPKVDNEDEARPYFKIAYDLFDRLKSVNQSNIKMEYLSMGMSGDYKAAIKEGSNMIRIGTAIFGERKNKELHCE
ncbi:MAG: YggS family pyridoxal phosphate-dependent enzyme [Thermoanaerobacteraceae bacterium]|nr:YggS family pyridoxal phosphate-dependent enzyme [Thermoanaerobacteraceae bacterium]